MNLLDDPRVAPGVKETLSHYFTENNNGEVSKGILWEGHRAVVRGKLIAWGNKVKREIGRDYEQVFRALQQAELLHKQTADTGVLRRLTEPRTLFS